MKIMTSKLADIDAILDYGDKVVDSRKKIELALLGSLATGSVTCVINECEDSSAVDALVNIACYGNDCLKGPFGHFIKKVLDNAVDVLADFSQRSVFTIDCSTLKKGDAYGFLSQLSNQNDAVVVIENATSIPEGDSQIYDDKAYVENVLLHAWKNEHIVVGDLQLERDRFSIFIISPKEGRDELVSLCRSCGFGWCDSIDALLWLKE